ncbi:hypothetical protein BH23ACT9_BH23ACT9_36870 [soil metagenome]
MADARRRLAEVLDAVEGGTHVSITRRGRPVARLVPPDEYDLLVQGRPDVWVAIDGFRSAQDLIQDGWDEGLRSADPGRDAPFAQ